MALYNWGDEFDCSNNNWLYINNDYLWFLTPALQHLSYVYIVYRDTGNVYYNYTYNIGAVFPSVYLDAEIKIASGIGSKENPFILSI